LDQPIAQHRNCRVARPRTRFGIRQNEDQPPIQRNDPISKWIYASEKTTIGAKVAEQPIDNLCRFLSNDAFEAMLSRFILSDLTPCAIVTVDGLSGY
jgi:hypothetical protein